MKFIFNFAFLIIFLWTNVAFGQKKTEGIETNELKKKLKIADILFDEHSYYNATDLYLELFKVSPQNEYLLYKLGVSYFKSRDYYNADIYFRKLAEWKKEKTLYPLAIFYFAETLRMTGKYERAKKVYLGYLKTRGNSKEDRFNKNITRNLIRSCDFALEMIAFDTVNNIKISLLPGEINNAYSDFSPYKIHEDTMVFASLRSDSVVSLKYGGDETHPVKIYQSIKEDSLWGAPSELENFNHFYDHSADGVYSPDRLHFYFTRCRPNKSYENICSIFVSELKNGKWGKPKKHRKGINLRRFTSTQPAFGTIEKVVKKVKKEYPILYFVSDRPGGKGKKDIWYSVLNEKGYSKPTNCGIRINTVWDEITPFYDNKSKSLYFSSNYHWNAGGFDVFKCTGSLNKWDKPTNLGLSVNSSYDDFYYSVPQPASSGMVVSNRPGGMALKSATCCDDIYQIHVFQPPLLAIAGVTKPENKTKPKVLPGVAVGIIPTGRVKNHLNKYHNIKYLRDSIQWVDTTNIEGNFDLRTFKSKNYSLIFAKDSFDVKIFSIDTAMQIAAHNNSLLEVLLPDLKDSSDVKVFTDMKPKTAIAKATSQETESIAKFNPNTPKDLAEGDVYLLDKISFETGKDVVSKDALPALDVLFKFLKENPKLKIEISGHTDSQGSEKFNLDLSQKRANSIVSYLTNKGINKKRIIAQGYGESQPIAPNENPDGSENTEGMKLNRRTEIKILEAVEEE